MKEIDPFIFFRKANKNPQLWLKLVGAEMRHSSFGQGRITSIEEIHNQNRYYIYVIFDNSDAEITKKNIVSLLGNKAFEGIPGTRMIDTIGPTLFNSGIFEKGLVQTLYISDELYLSLEEKNNKSMYNESYVFQDLFYNRNILNWLMKDFNVNNYDDFFNGVVTTGSGPIKESDFNNLLESKGIDVHKSGDVEIMVVGRNDCDLEIINDQLDRRRNSGIKIYSQEMVIVYFLTGNDPHEEDDVLYEFGKGHPTINYLIECGFPWPTSKIDFSGGSTEFDPVALQEVGLLKYLGYTTGIKGERKDRRQTILRRAYTAQIHGLDLPENYLREWGHPQTSERLLKLGNVISSLARNAKRRENPPRDAIRDWEEDLEWLKENFYKGAYRFQWPDTYIG